MANDDISVRVAVRVRPQVASEVIDMCRVCTRATPGEPQLTLGADKSFTFDYVFDTDATQGDLYEACVAPLVRGALDGYNATVLAYGQTGSGKTYTMGTGFEPEITEETRGVVPRALRDLFTGITERCEGARAAGRLPPEFAVTAQFLELYNEEIIDLFDPTSSHYNAKDWSGNRLRIVEDVGGGVRVTGAACQAVRDAPAALACLRLGALARTTAATNMNAASSRSHAVFTLHVKQQRLVRNEDPDADMDTTMDPTNEFETLSAKFHFVDLAGSERLKRTGATGERAREGISINCGLLALGNVISALGDKSRRVTHVPYRDSKLTRLLQDSLGGNSQTVMIACVSPSDRDFMETLNTLKYANRARNIKNRIVVNQDKSSRTISMLRHEIAQLQLELLEFKQGKRIASENGEDGMNDTFHENQVLQSEVNNLRLRVKAMQSTIEQLSERNSQLLAERALGAWTRAGEDAPECNLTDLVQGYVKEIEELRAKMLEADHMQQALKKSLHQRQANAMGKSFTLSADSSMMDTSAVVLSEAKRELYREKELLARSVGELEFQRKLSQGAPELADMGERERAEGESADDSDRSEEDSDSEDDTDSEAKVCAAIGAELASLSGDIDTKQRLIEELERSQRQLHSMRRHYEDKLLALHSKIKLTQEERDKVLASYGTQSSAPSDKVRRVREEYERRLGELQREVRRLQSAQREHTRLLRDHSATEAHIRSIKNELADMKRTKVKLLNKMKEESTRHKQAETRRNREIAQLRKESRKNANVIRNLEAEKRLKEQVLRRKQEEVTALRRGTKQNKLSEKASGRKIDNYALKTAKHKWQILEKTLRSTALRKQAVGDMEHDMERQLAERERLGKELERLRGSRAHAAAAGRDLADLDNEIDTVTSNVDYLQESIAEAQHHIMQFEESKDGGDEGELQSVLGGIRNVAEARYLIDKLYHLSVNHIYTASQKDLLLKDSQAKIHEMELCSEEKEKMMRTVMYEGGYAAPPLDSPATSPRVLVPITKFSEISSGTSTRSVSPVDSTLIELRNDAKNLSKRYPWLETSPPTSEPTSAASSERSPFQRNSPSRGSVRLREIGVMGSDDRADIMTQSLSEAPHTGQPLAKVPSAPGSLKGLVPSKQYSGDQAVRASPLLARRSPAGAADGGSPRLTLRSPADAVPRLAPRTPDLPPASPRLSRRTFSLSGPTPHPLLGRPGSMERLEESGSPPVSRRAYDDVFCRLAANITSEPTLTGGQIKQYTGKWSQRAALQCTHVAEGHTNAVLSLCATDRLLISASADRTVKVWDLERGTERETLAAHPHSVVCVRYEPCSGLLYSVSGAFVRVHDLRCSPHSYIKTLCSSGATQSGNWGAGRGLPLPTGECSITDAVLNPAATLLYTTANDKLRIWDTRRLECVGKISSGHQAAIMCLTVGSTPENDDIVITGSKDHYVKVMEVRGGVAALTSTTRCLLEPPHYDGVQCLALLGNTLFSGSRDMSIKKWNLNTQELVHSVNGAHKGWVTGLCTWGDGVVVSCGRGGRLRVWDAAAANTSRSLAHAHIDDSLNAVATNATHIFTAANSGEVRVWRWATTEQ